MPAGESLSQVQYVTQEPEYNGHQYTANTGYWDNDEHVYAFVIGPTVGPHMYKDGALYGGSVSGTVWGTGDGWGSHPLNSWATQLMIGHRDHNWHADVKWMGAWATELSASQLSQVGDLARSALEVGALHGPEWFQDSHAMR